MIRWLIRRKLDSLEKQIGQPVDYLRHLTEVSLSAFCKFAMIGPIASHRRAAPREMIHAARLVAAKFEDCGPCVEIAAKMAVEDGVDRRIVAAIVADDLETAPADVALACRFAAAVVERNGADGELREQLRARFSEAVVVELSLAIAFARVFPTLKRGMGYAVSCSVSKPFRESSQADMVQSV